KPGFTILDRSDSEDVVNLLRSRAGLDRKERRFPRKSAIVEIFSMAVNRSTTVPALLEDGYVHLYEHLDDLVRLEEEYRRYKREQNYRSTQPILDLANAVIDRAAEKHTKILHAERGAGGPPVLLQCADEQAQSRFVCQRILELREEGVPLGEIAVLFRSSFHSFDLELELQRADIPFVKRGGFKCIETAHVKDVLAHLRIVANPRDAVSW